MDKQQAQTIIKETFEKSFNKDRFNGFIKNFLNQIEDAPFSYQGNYIPDAYKPFVSRYERLGKYNDGEKRIDILIVYLNKETSIERARTSQRNFIAGYLDGKYGSDVSKNAALVAFVSPNEEDWRFSLVKMDYRFEQAKNGKVKVKEEFTPARRWSFLVGKNESSHTAQSRLVPRLADDEHNPTLAQMEEAFNVEKVTKEFFEKYRELFLWTKETLDKIAKQDAKIEADFEAKGVNTIDFAKKLLGQVVFLYFLQRKGWFGVERDAEWGTGTKQFLRELFQGRHGQYGNFFNDILEPLFYEALRIDRRHDYNYYSHFNCKIPFLNGGLFDPINGYDWVHTDILLPNELFSNQNKTKEGDIGNGILDIFDRYNFTVKEDEPLEKEVAIDPEMLGKVFENLLEVKDRKSKGSYYTPREIVHYMCQQSLINYLNTELNKGVTLYQNTGDIQTNAFGNETKVGQLDLTVKHKSGPQITKEDIETLIKYGEHFGENEATVEVKGRETDTYSYKLSENIRRNAKLIDQKLASIEVCDPAIGSGAFPVGMMHEIVKTRNVLSAFIKAPDRTVYHFKRECIEKSLYGVDIDPGAVEIAKLRLWLSLVVDEEDIKQIKPLPNLDYKIVCGNSLLGYPYTPTGLEKIEKLKELFFNETRAKEKNELREQIDRSIYDLFKNTEKSLGYKVNFDFEINFSEVFHKKNGFDVVIANPPYQGFRGLDKKLKAILKKNYESAQGKFDLYIPFIEKSYTLLRKRGFFTFICQTAFTKREHGKHIRRFLLNNVTLYEIVDFEHSQVFDSATNYTGVFSFIKSANNQQSFIYKAGFSGDKSKINQSEFSEEPWVFVDAESTALFGRIKENPVLGEIAIISEGVVTGLNELYLKTKFELKEMCFEQNYFFPTYRGKEVHKFHLQKNSQFLFYPYAFENSKTFPVKEEILRKKSPNYFEYLNKHRNLIERRSYFSKSNKKWFELWNQRDLKNFVREKIISPELSERNSFMISGPNTFYGDTVCGILLKQEFQNKLDLKYLLAILNSWLIEWFYKKTTVPKAGGFFIYKVMYLKTIPTAICEKSEQLPLISFVDRIFAITKDKDYLQDPQKQSQVKALEWEIDQMVYQLYGLTEEEIQIVEGDK